VFVEVPLLETTARFCPEEECDTRVVAGVAVQKIAGAGSGTETFGRSDAEDEVVFSNGTLTLAVPRVAVPEPNP
jgi:hypothetical protein